MPPYNNEDTFISESNVLDIKRINPELVDTFEQIEVLLNNIALRLNMKDIGSYHTNELFNGQTYFPDLANNKYSLRPVYRKVIDFGALPNTGTTNVAHGIVFPAANTFTFTRIYGATNDLTAGSYIPLPYSSPVLANNIELSVNNTNVSITTGSDRTMYTVTYIVLEYIKE